MVSLKIQVTIKGEPKRAGVQFQELLRVGGEAYKFLRLLAVDLSLDLKAEDWIALPPSRGSYVLNLRCDSPVPVTRARSYRAKIERISKYRPKRSKVPQKVSRETMIQFAKVGEQLGSGESVKIGASVRGEKRPKTATHELSRDRSLAILEEMEQTLHYHGSVQGTVHNITLGASPPYLHLRELSSQKLVKCIYKPEHYRRIIKLLGTPSHVLIVSGEIAASREPRAIESLEIDRIEEAHEITDEEFERLFGSAPDLTGDLSTDEFLDGLWDGE